jgi:hypothetical protein
MIDTFCYLAAMKRIILLLAILLPLTAEAGSYYMNSQLVTQVRENAINEREVPLDFYLDTGFRALPHEGSFDVSLRNNRIFNIKDDEFDLYQAVFRMNNLGGWLDFSAGRQFISPGFQAYMMDGVTFTIGKDDWPLLWTLIGGVPRYIETGDFHGNVGLLAGTTVELNGFDNTHIKLSALYNKIRIKRNDWKENDTVLTGLAVSQQFGGKVKPNLYGDFEYDTAGKVIDNSTLGFSLQPHRRVYWNAEGGYYNTNRDWAQPSILGIYSLGGMYQANTGINVILADGGAKVDEISLVAGYSYQRYKSGTNLNSNGHIANAGLNFSILPIHLDAGLAYSYYDCFGGRAHDVKLVLYDEPIDKLYFNITANYTKYSKVTNENDNAIGLYWMIGYEVAKGLVLSAGGEYMRNNNFTHDIRATAQLSYSLEKKL